MRKLSNICIAGMILYFGIIQDSFASNFLTEFDVSPDYPKQPSTDIKLNLQDKLETNSPRVYINDIATCTGDDNLCEEILGVDIGLNLEAEETVIFDKKSLANILKKEFPNNSITYNSVNKISIQSSGSVLDSDVLGSKLQRTLTKLFKKFPGYSVEITSMHTPSNIKVWNDTYTVKFPDLESEEYHDVKTLMKKCLGHKTIKTQIIPTSTSAKKREFVIHVNTAIKQQIPIATHEIERGSIISKDDYAIRWYQLKFTHQNIINRDDLVIGKRAKRKIMPGSPFLTEMLDQPPVVKRGQIVKLIINKKTLNVAASVKSMGEGRVGDTIRVLFPISNRQIYAKVIDSSSVESVD